MRIALIDPLGRYAGNHHYTDQLACGLVEAGADVTVYSYGGGSGPYPNRPYECLESFQGIYGSQHPAIRGLRFLGCLVGVMAGIAKRRTDVVHVQLWSHDIRELLQVAFAKLLGKKVVLTLHEVKGWSSRQSSPGSAEMHSDGDPVSKNLQWMMSQTGGLIVHNRYSLEVLHSNYEVDKPSSVIPHVNQVGSLGDLPDRSAARQRLGLPNDKFVFLFFGNCRHEKGLDLALRALAELKDQADDVLLVTAGKMKTSEEDFFRGLAKELDLGALLRMDVRFIPDDQALDYYRAANVLVIPYRRIYESGVAITASSCQRAVIASDLLPLLEATENGLMGLHFRSGDPHDLAKVMKQALTMSEELDARGAKAREKVLRERDPKIVGAQTFALYQQVLAGTTSKGIQ